MLVEGAWESSVAPPTGPWRLKHALAKNTLYLDVQPPAAGAATPGDPCASAFVAGTPDGAPASPEAHNSATNSGCRALVRRGL